jgi:hypothetical protein
MTGEMDGQVLKHELQQIADDWQARMPERTKDYEDFFRALSEFAAQLKKAVKKSMQEE